MLEVGGSLHRSLRHGLAAAVAAWPVCEVVPESWDPDDPDDIAYLENLDSKTRFYLHSLSLNALGDGPPEAIFERICRWRERLKADSISDHFSWTGAGGVHPGVFLPPVEGVGEIRGRVRRLSDRLGCQLILENIALAGRSAEEVLRYHEILLEVCSADSIPVLLDIENVRLDALVSGVPPERLLLLYDQVDVQSYHIAGSDSDGEIADSHRHACSQESIELLRRMLLRRRAPVFYERDYELDPGLIAAEVARLSQELRNPDEQDKPTL